MFSRFNKCGLLNYFYLYLFVNNAYSCNSFNFINKNNKLELYRLLNIKENRLSKDELFKMNKLKSNSYNDTYTMDKRIDKLICITPGGFYGFYMLGVCKFLRDNYDLNEYKYMGSSAGAWISLLMCYKGDILNLIEKLDMFDNKLKSNIKKITCNLKNNILKITSDSDFELDKLLIGLSHYEYLSFEPYIYYNFTKLSDALDACIASSHIPFVTSDKMILRFNDKCVFDGGVLDFPYFLDIYNPALIIYPDLWNKKRYEKKNMINDVIHAYNSTTLIRRKNKKLDMYSLFVMGQTSCKENKEYLDILFSKKT